MGEFIRPFENDKNPFIVYDVGHGRIESDYQAERICRRDSTSAQVRQFAIEPQFAETMSDTFISLDACAAASAVSRSHGCVETIMASGFEARAPPPGELFVTDAFVDFLENWVMRPSFSASYLHAETLSKLMKPANKGRESTKLGWCIAPITSTARKHHHFQESSYAGEVSCCVPASFEPCEDSTFIDAMIIDFTSSSSVS